MQAVENMSDNIDQLTEDAERAYEIAVKIARRSTAGRGRTHCENCEQPIPEARRKAAPWATRCRDCQEAYEARERRNAGSARPDAAIGGDE